MTVATPAYSAMLDIGSMILPGGSFMVWDTNGDLISNSCSTAADKTVTPLTAFGPDPASIGTANWFGGYVNIYTAAANLGDPNSPAASPQARYPPVFSIMSRLPYPWISAAG